MCNHLRLLCLPGWQTFARPPHKTVVVNKVHRHADWLACLAWLLCFVLHVFRPMEKKTQTNGGVPGMKV